MLNIRLWFSGQLVTLENPTSPYFFPWAQAIHLMYWSGHCGPQ